MQWIFPLDPDDECRDADKIVSQLMKLLFYWENKFIRVKLPMMNIGILIVNSSDPTWEKCPPDSLIKNKKSGRHLKSVSITLRLNCIFPSVGSYKWLMILSASRYLSSWSDTTIGVIRPFGQSIPNTWIRLNILSYINICGCFVASMFSALKSPTS